MKKNLILITIIIGLFLCINSVKAYDMSSWKDISQFTLPEGVNKDSFWIVIFQRQQNSFYRMLYMPKTDYYYFGTNKTGETFPYSNYINTYYGNGGWYNQYWYDSTGPNDYSITRKSSSTGASFSNYKIIYTNANIYEGSSKNNALFFDYNVAFPPITYPTFENTLYVEGENIKLKYTFTQWTDANVDYIKTGPLLQKTYTRQEYLENNEFSIIVRFPQQNYLMPIEYYDTNNDILKTEYINLKNVIEEMPQDQANEVIAQEEYQKDIYQWESGDYSSTIKNTINNSSQVIKWARDLVQYIFDSFPSEVKYAIISVFIVFLVCCITRMIWR